MTYVNKYFTDKEWSCKCGCNEQPQDAIKELGDFVRHDWGKPLLIASGKRCEKHNKTIGGAPRSAHVAGLAVDLRPFDMDQMAEFHKFCESKLEEWKCRMESPLVTVNWCHLDLYPVGTGGRVFKP
jgi:hypothetical protein